MTHCYPPIPAQAAPYYYHEEDSKAFKAGDDDDDDEEEQGDDSQASIRGIRGGSSKGRASGSSPRSASFGNLRGGGGDNGEGSSSSVPQPSQPQEEPEKTTYAGWTYGALLTSNEEYNRYDPMLRLCVQRCLDHDPASRPTLAYLQFAIEYFVTRGEEGHSAESDQRLRRAVERVFGGP